MTDHHTPEDIAIKIINSINIEPNSTILDPCAGNTKVFYNNFPINNDKKYCEIEEGIDFLNYNENVDYIISNPPFERKILWQFILKSIEIVNKEIYFLLNIDCLNVFTIKRMKIINDKGFYLNMIKFLEIKKWYGRYVLIRISKEKNKDMDLL
jgi:hypothetical protein